MLYWQSQSEAAASSPTSALPLLLWRQAWGPVQGSKICPGHLFGPVALLLLIGPGQTSEGL